MKRIIMYTAILLSPFLPLTIVNIPKAEANDYINETQTAYLNPIKLNSVDRSTEAIDSAAKVFCSDAKSCLENMEFSTIKLKKGRKFIVKSDSRLSNEIYSGTAIKFESPQKESIFYKHAPSKVIFQGKIVKTNSPRKVGKSGMVKVELDKITIDKVTYPVAAIISKIENKNIRNNNLIADSIYLANLADIANTGTIHSSLKDPCLNNNCTEGNSNVKRPALFLVGAALGAADLLISPFVSLLKPGKNVNIPENTYFEIKLDEDLYVLNI